MSRFAPARSMRRAAAIAIFGTLVGASVASARTPVDPGTLIPPPPPGSTCEATGRFIVCDTSFEIHGVNVPIDFGLACGTVYESLDDVRRGKRWYDADSLLIVKRLVFQDLAGTWSLSPDGSGPVIRLSAHSSWSNVEFPDPFDESTWPTALHGNALTASAPGHGVIIHFAGLDRPDGTHHGAATDFLDAPDVAAEACDALGG